MAKLLVADDNGIPYVEITADDDGYHGHCGGCGVHLFHHRELDLIALAEAHVDQKH